MQNILSTLYESNLSKYTILQRKVIIENNYTILRGAPKTGKTYLIYDYLLQYNKEEYLYIDMADIRIDFKELFLYLNNFLLKHKITVLAIDNFNFDFDLNSLSGLSSIIVSTTNSQVKLDKFNTQQLMALDFEEFILFDNKHQNTINSFNSFFKYGNLAELIQYNDTNKLIRNQEIIQLITQDPKEFNIFKLLLQNIGESKSIFQLYGILKKSSKISKDFFYNSCKKFEDNLLINFIPKFEQPKAPKKIYSYNHAFIDAVNLHTNINNRFSNLVFCELNKDYQYIYYLDNVDFYIKETNSIYISKSFISNYVNLSTKLIPIIEEFNIQNITIITVNTSNTIYINDIECEVIPFYEWALSL